MGWLAAFNFWVPLANETLPKLYQTADVVVFPSIVAADGDREGFGLVLVEALGCECAAVVTDLPAMRDIVHDGKTALVVPQQNAQQIAAKVIQLLDNPSLRRSLGKGPAVCDAAIRLEDCCRKIQDPYQHDYRRTTSTWPTTMIATIEK